MNRGLSNGRATGRPPSNQPAEANPPYAGHPRGRNGQLSCGRRDAAAARGPNRTELRPAPPTRRRAAWQEHRRRLLVWPEPCSLE